MAYCAGAGVVSIDAFQPELILLSIKTKYAAFGAGVALTLLVGCLAAFVLFRDPSLVGLERWSLAWILFSGAALAIIGSAGAAFFFGGRLTRTLRQLNDSTVRMAQGDYTQPVKILHHDELGDLQRTVETMRQSLRQTTITKNYLDSILNSMSDAVFVTDKDGSIRVTNHAALVLTGLDEGAIRGRDIATLLHAPEQTPAQALQRARESGESVLRSRSGQTIPVSFSTADIETDDPQFAGRIFVARDITDRKRAERRIRYLARYDALTKIPNRMQFQHLLQQSIARSLRTHTGLALLYLDMDRFKEVNDTFGHAAGDRVLEVLTERLTQVLPDDTVIGRLAGDEFALFIDGVSEPSAREVVKHLSADILTAVAQPFHINQQEIFLSASIGVALCPRDAENVIDLIRNADAAMYYSKQNGGNSCAFYSTEMNEAAVERLMLKSKLKRAVERDELVIRYMPKVKLADGKIVGAEALLRWRLPGHGDIPPSQFIPLAEENNLISLIGEWVLNRVCLDHRQLAGEGHDPGRIALNLSLKQLRQASFILDCRSVFTRHGVSPESLELEITETTLMADPKRTIAMLKELSALGLHLSIDDFGTGYSSLSALQQFPIGTLKVDQSFVRDVVTDPNDATLVRTIIEMGRSLGMEVVGEGVETVEQLAFLRKSRCDIGQGELFGKPCTVDELAVLLTTQEANGVSPFASFVTQARAMNRGNARLA
jgi:diguanylate cyclase (GGDEF)-like protein/PAS domain S-box-containing protein